MPAELTYPVQVLREHIVALEAGLSVCLADPGPKAVHRLRTETRRIEAQVLLLDQLSPMPEHGDEASRLRRALRRLRRAAGEVRDLDVQCKRLEELADAQPDVAENQPEGKDAPDAADEDQVQAQAQAPMAEDLRSSGQALAKGAAALRDHLRNKREHAGADLQKLLKKHQARTARAAEALLKAFEDAEQVSLSAAALVQHAQDVLLRDGLPTKADVKSLGENDLHSVRKSAKAARYLAETLPGSPVADTAAGRFEALQQAGGQWHDALDLARAARRFLGKSHALTVFIAADRDRHLSLYRKTLREVHEVQQIRRELRPQKAAGQTPRKTARKRVLAAA